MTSIFDRATNKNYLYYKKFKTSFYKQALLYQLFKYIIVKRLSVKLVAKNSIKMTCWHQTKLLSNLSL